MTRKSQGNQRPVARLAPAALLAAIEAGLQLSPSRSRLELILYSADAVFLRVLNLETRSHRDVSAAFPVKKGALATLLPRVAQAIADLSSESA